MRISLAEVRNTFDPYCNGAFEANIDVLGGINRPVYYVSPYGSNTEGAMVAIPEQGTRILVCQPENTDHWFYLGTLFWKAEQEDATGGVIPDAGLNLMNRVDPFMYRAQGVPMRYLFRSPSSAGLTISEEHNDKLINQYVELKTAKNKVVKLIDTPEQDSIVLDSGNGSTIHLTANPQYLGLPDQGLQIHTVGAQRHFNLKDQTDMVVMPDGKELQLLNYATGVPWGETSIKSGNVNIQSKWKDVNIFSQAEQGRIFIECLNESGSNQQIVIETNGADGSIVIKTKGKVKIEAGSDINMKAGGDVNIDCSKFSVSCDTVEVKSTSTVNIDGPLVNLANGAAPNPVDTEGSQSTYGNVGITTWDVYGTVFNR